MYMNIYLGKLEVSYINTAIVIGAANGIISARNCTLFLEYGGHISITKGWAKSILN